MSQVTIENFAKQIGISIEKLLDQLEQAGISGKGESDLLEDALHKSDFPLRVAELHEAFPIELDSKFLVFPHSQKHLSS